MVPANSESLPMEHDDDDAAATARNPLVPQALQQCVDEPQDPVHRLQRCDQRESAGHVKLIAPESKQRRVREVRRRALRRRGPLQPFQQRRHPPHDDGRRAHERIASIVPARLRQEHRWGVRTNPTFDDAAAVSSRWPSPSCPRAHEVRPAAHAAPEPGAR